MIAWFLQRDGEYQKCDIREVPGPSGPRYMLYVTSSGQAGRLESFPREDVARRRWTELERDLRHDGWWSANDFDL